MRLAASIWIAFALSQPAIPQTDDALLGLWGCETSFGPQVRGELTLERHGSTWTMRAGGFEASFAASGDEIRGALPGGNGELRAHLEDGGKAIRGFWIQPRGNLASYASPVTLDRVRAGGWRGSIAPLEDRLSMYLVISRSDDGSLRGSFRNPEMNWNGGGPWFRVVRKEESIELIDPENGKVRFVQPYDARQRQIGMDFGTPIALTPRTPDRAVGFYPRSPVAAPYRYRPPLAASDGWQTARARDVGMEEELLRALVERIITVDPAAGGAPRIHSLLVARHGKLVLEEYFYGYTAERPHDLRSASKTFTSLMAGIAMDRDKSLTIKSPVDPQRPITLGHLLTHSSGLACDDNDDASPGNEDTMQGQQKQNDWYRYFLDLPAVHPPGTTYAYCSAGINMAGGVVARSSGSWLPDFFDRTIARPLQIDRYSINLMPDGQAYGGGGIYMRPRDVLKLGQTYLGGGVWNGRRIVSKEWVRTSTAHQIRTSGGGSDGYGWHRHTLVTGGREHQEYEASGNGGQFVIVVPDLDLAIAITAGNYNQYGIWRTFRDELVPKYVLAAVAPALSLRDEISRADAALFEAFNAHDLAKVKTFFSEDLEFFHDTGGLLSFKSAMGGMESNFAQNNGLRRDLVEGSLEVYPIKDYGAIETGVHAFCHVENGRNDCGTFKFVHVWQKKDGRWRITRVVSYGH